eukprot:TRINITY_DN16083_c0_g1_i2.p1 TRINITY_DN16083_c0_g1~~TRINITY_DN16083_c0_g1_i2.p1  ORF type:complete len:214 (-),score=37.86 TRINITY_DN16083_c0_g1_i2:149-748(-)
MASLVAATGDQGLCLPSGIHEGALSSAATFLETIPGGISRRGAVSSSTAFLEAVPRGGAVSSSSSAFLGTVPRGHVRLVGRAASFFDSADLAPPLGLPPPEGWGEGNDSECMTCACDSKLATGEKLQEKHQKLVFPNVPHHSFFPHTTGYRLGNFKIFLVFLGGSVVGYFGVRQLRESAREEKLGEDESAAAVPGSPAK